MRLTCLYDYKRKQTIEKKNKTRQTKKKPKPIKNKQAQQT